MSQIQFSNPNTGTVTVVNPDGSQTVLPGSPIAPYPQFPILATKYAAQAYNRKNLDQTIVNETDGGYEYSRPKNTNFKRREWSLGFELMPDNELNVLRGFVENVGNCGGCFSWVDPTTQEMYLVRFTSVPNEVYVGFGATSFMWNVDFKVRSIKLLSQSYTGYVQLLPFGPTTGGLYHSISITPALTGNNLLAWYLNGLLVPATKYTLLGPSTIALVDGISSSDTLTGFAYTPKFTTTAGESSLALATGAIDGVNRTFTSSINMIGSALVMLFLNGTLQDPTNYSISADGGTFTMKSAPLSGFPADTLTLYVW